MPESHPSSQLSLTFAKLVATPTETSWSQAYNAGNVFACLALTTEETFEENELQSTGKNLFNILQSEFFTLQEKNISHIKNALQTTLSHIPEHMTVSLSLAFFKDATLYVFIAGSGKIVMKRGEKIGTLLMKQDSSEGTITSASGFMQNGDTIILETGQFSHGISNENVAKALELALPNDIVEALSPQILQQDNGAQAAIVISYQGASQKVSGDMYDEDNEVLPIIQETETLPSTYDADTPPEEPETYEEEIEQKKHVPLTLPKLPHPHVNFHLNHRRRLFLNIAIIIALLLAASIFFTIKKYNDDKEHALFQSIYPPAQQYYSEGNGLATVNASLSQQRYQKAESLLKDGEAKIPQGTQDYQQISDLLTKVENAMQNGTSGQVTNATVVSPQARSLLAVEQTMSDGLAFGQDENNVYVITNKGIETVSKADGTTKTIIKNNNDWNSPVAIVPYSGNMYVLDPQKGLLKFVAGGGGYGKSTYFKGTAPDLSQTTGMAIDSSIWLVSKDGTIMQYTSGKSNGLTISGLTKPLSNPTKIVTDITMESIYVLDAGNNRIVQFDKNGKYQNAYTSSVIASAKDFTVSETNKTIQLLSGGKVYQINL